MNDPEQAFHVGSMVVVPTRPGPLVRLDDVGGGRDDIDDLLDDVFGTPDDRGPGVVDGVLLIGGAGAVVAAQVGSLPAAVTVGGVLAVGLGAILPVRSLWRRFGSARRTSRLSSLIGDGALLRTDAPSVGRLVEAYVRLEAASAGLAAAPRQQVASIGHAAMSEVAALLDGRSPSTDPELDYVAARTAALDELRVAIADERTGDGEADRRRAMVEARREVEAIAGGSSVTDAAALARDLLGGDGC